MKDSFVVDNIDKNILTILIFPLIKYFLIYSFIIVFILGFLFLSGIISSYLFNINICKITFNNTNNHLLCYFNNSYVDDYCIWKNIGICTFNGILFIIIILLIILIIYYIIKCYYKKCDLNFILSNKIINNENKELEFLIDVDK